MISFMHSAWLFARQTAEAPRGDEPRDGFLLRIDPDGTITSATSGASQVLSYTQDELDGRSFFDLVASRVACISRVADDMQRRKGCFLCLEMELVRKDGTPVTVEVCAHPIVSSGTLKGYQCTVTVKPRPPGEVPGRTRSQGELFLDLLCHDLQNVNQIGIGFLELARESLGAGSEAHQYIDICIQALLSGSCLIDDVRKLQQIGRVFQKLEPVDVGRVLRGLVRRFRATHGPAVTIDYAPAAGHVVLANKLLDYAFSNIIGTAIERSAGRAIIGIAVEEIVDGGVRYCRVAVEDHGPGIPDEQKARLFERCNTGRMVASGMDVGLSQVRTIVKTFKGMIWVEDRVPGDHRKGCRFVVMIPATPPC